MLTKPIVALVLFSAVLWLTPACSDDAAGGDQEVCGDGEVTASEACDDGNQRDGDGCSAACAQEEGWLCEGSPSQCSIDCQSLQCDDQNPCTLDSCDPVEGCLADGTGITDACDDSNACTSGDTCQGDQAGSCAGADTSATDCDDQNPCTDDACDPFLGCSNLPNTLACDDQDPCTGEDACSDGECQGNPLTCDDENACTDDSCDPDTGCVHQDISDGCDDQNACTADSCDPAQGCVYDGTGITAACDDGNVCTTSDACQADPAGTCAGQDTSASDCDDQNPCTIDACDPADGCYYEFNTDPCDDESVCTEDDLCTDGECVGTPIVCDDGNGCTNDTCHAVVGCEFTLISSFDCRPDIVVTYPPRAATIQDAGSPVVTVTGTVTSGAGPITTFTLNGEDVTLDQDGAFAHPVAVMVGGNTLVFDATDELGAERHRVQAFLWSSVYRKPLVSDPFTGVTPEGLGAWLSQEVIDDGDHSLPIDDVATAVEVVLGNLDIASFIPSPVANLSQVPLGDYDVFINNLVWDTPRITLNSINGGLRLHLAITNVSGDLYVDRTCGWNPITCLGPGSMSGDVSIDSIVADTDILISIDANHMPVVTTSNTSVDINGLDISIDGIFGFIADWIIGFFIDDFASDLEQELANQIANEIGPALEGMLAALVLSADYDIPMLDGSGGSVTISLETDFNEIDFSASGGLLVYRTVAYANQVTPYDNLGAPGRAGCGAGPQELVLSTNYEMSLSLSDDLVTQLFYAAWQGGLLEFQVPLDMLGITQQELDEWGITELQVSLSGMLAPTPSDCAAPGDLEIHTGDLRLDVSLKIFDEPLSLIGYGTISFGVHLGIVDQEIQVLATGLRTAELEASVQQEEYAAMDPIFTSILYDFLTGEQGLASLLNNQVLVSIPIPEIDLSGLAGMPPGTAILITPDSIAREQGNTVIDAHATASKE